MHAILAALMVLTEPYPAPEICDCDTDAECEVECDGRICNGRFYCDGWCVDDPEHELCKPK